MTKALLMVCNNEYDRKKEQANERAEEKEDAVLVQFRQLGQFRHGALTLTQ
jgi:hypothetical protein